jgi:hypothetical protein
MLSIIATELLLVERRYCARWGSSCGGIVERLILVALGASLLELLLICN